MNNFNIKLPDDVQFIIHTLQLHGFEAYAVGGCVRDSILGQRTGRLGYYNISNAGRDKGII